MPQDAHYDGPARLAVDGREIEAHVRLSGQFEPITGAYRWTGRLRPGDEVRETLRQNLDVVITTGDDKSAEATVREQDPWGGFRIIGSGHPPFAVPTETL
jgi:hypothetical protein